jgi:uncharacterized membrane protein HdeD (DUF308 family)
MNTSEGIRRIATAIRWVGDVVGGLLIGVAAFGTIHGWVPGGGENWTVLTLGLIFGVPLIVGGRLLSWIINGFAEPKSSPGHSPDHP